MAPTGHSLGSEAGGAFVGHALGLPCGDKGRGGQTLRTHSVVHSPAASAPSRAPCKKCRVSGSALVLLKEKLHFNKIPE